MKNQLSQKQNQVQSLSQLQKQSLGFLEFSNEEAEKKIIEVYENNPLVEFTPKSVNEDNFFDGILDFYSVEKTLRDILFEQLRETKYSNSKNAFLIIESINEYGYLDEHFLDENQMNDEEFKKVLKCIQKFEPSGVGARSLGECIKIQLDKSPNKQKIKIICDRLLPEVGTYDFEKISQVLGVSPDEVAELVREIKTCNPRPGLQYQSKEIVMPPDIIVEIKEGIEIRLTDDFSSFKVKEIGDLLDDKKMKDYLSEAKNLIDFIHKRNETITQVTLKIVGYQLDFFTNNGNIKPLSMKTIANELDLHESTVSRTLKNKTIKFGHQIYPLSFFFPAEVGTLWTQKQIVEKIKILIEMEDKISPLSDQDIVESLSGYGIEISRRAVAKYRMLNKIDNSSMRLKKYKMSK